MPSFLRVMLKLTCSPVSTRGWSATRRVLAMIVYLPVIFLRGTVVEEEISDCGERGEEVVLSEAILRGDLSTGAC